VQEALEETITYGKRALPIGVAVAGLGGLIGIMSATGESNNLTVLKGGLIGATAGFMVGTALGTVGLAIFDFKIPRLTLAMPMLAGGSVMLYSLSKSPDNPPGQLMKSTAMGVTAGLMLGLPIDYIRG
jgi:tetrahydromethanopterin S-methyltransferase subunit C